MKNIKLETIFPLVVVLFTVLMAHAKSNHQVLAKKVAQKVVSVQSKNKVEPVSIPERSAPKGFLQGYKMVTDVLDGFGGESESDNYRIPINSGGQPSAIGISESDNYVVKAGYVHTSHIKRGDANADGGINISDVVYLTNYLFVAGSPPPIPFEAGNVNCDGAVNISDVVYLTNYLFVSGSPPPCCL